MLLWLGDRFRLGCYFAIIAILLLTLLIAYESIANILNAMCRAYYDEGFYSLRQVCMYRLGDKGGGAPAPKAPALITYSKMQELTIILYSYSSLLL